MPAIAATQQEVDYALSLLGLTHSHLQNSLASAQALVHMVVNGLHPRYWHGVVAWGETTRFLREQLTAMGISWEEEPVSALPASIIKDGGTSVIEKYEDKDILPFEPNGYQIVVAGGDVSTGDKTKSPKFANLKGHLMVRAVRENGGNLPIFRIGNSVTFENPQMELNLSLDDPALSNEEVIGEECLSTWVLLIRYADDGVYAELSKPHSINNSGQIKQWIHRILLGRISAGPNIGVPIRSGDIGPSPEYGMTGDLSL